VTKKDIDSKINSKLSLKDVRSHEIDAHRLYYGMSSDIEERKEGPRITVMS
jgi:hypothetical protein